MNWSAYSYLLVVGIMCAFALFVVYRFMPSLLSKSHERTLVELAILGMITVLGLMAIYFNFYRGNLLFSYLDVGNDTTEQYLPYYYNMLDAIRSGTLDFWNHEYGLGVSFMSYQSWTLDPFNCVLIPLGLLLGNERLAFSLVMVQSLKVVLIAFMADHLLTYFCETPLARMLGALLCAFSGYIMLWGQHYWLGTVFVMATLMPLLLELLMERSTPLRFLGLAAGTALSIMSSVYSGFMVMLFATAYALLRAAYVAKGGPGGFLRLFGRLTVPVVCGILMACIAIVPYATLMLGESSRVVGEANGSLTSRIATYLGTFVPLRWIPMILSRAMGNGLVSYGDAIPDTIMPTTTGFSYVNVYEIITLGLSGGVFVLLSQFVAWVVREGDRRTKVLTGIATLLVLLYCVNFFLPAFSNAFVAPKYRSSFAVVLPVCIAMAVGFDRRVAGLRVARIPLVVSALLSGAVVFWSLLHSVDGRLACLWYLLALVCFTVCLWMLGKDDHETATPAAPSKHASGTRRQSSLTSQMRLACTLCCMAIVSTSVVDGFFSTNNRDICSPENLPSTQEARKDANTTAALAWLEEYDTSAWRAEKLYSDWTLLNDSLIQHYHGVSSYNSTLDGDVEEFYQRIWPEALIGDVAYQSFTNDPAEPSLLHMLGVKYLLSHDILDWDWCRELTQIGDVHVYRNMRADSILTLYGGVLGEGDVAGLDPSSLRSMLNATVIVPDESKGLITYDNPSMITLEVLPSLDLSWMTFEGWELNENGLPAAVPASQAKIDRTKGTSLSGKLFANVNSVACLSVPHVSGWTIRIDGQVVETTRADFGFIGFAVPAGVHSFEASYEAPHLRLGAICSCVGIVCALACSAFLARGRKDKDIAA